MKEYKWRTFPFCASRQPPQCWNKPSQRTNSHRVGNDSSLWLKSGFLPYRWLVHVLQLCMSARQSILVLCLALLIISSLGYRVFYLWFYSIPSSFVSRTRGYYYYYQIMSSADARFPNCRIHYGVCQYESLDLPFSLFAVFLFLTLGALCEHSVSPFGVAVSRLIGAIPRYDYVHMLRCRQVQQLGEYDVRTNKVATRPIIHAA